jgi:hypothetical protein
MSGSFTPDTTGIKVPMGSPTFADWELAWMAVSEIAT